MGRAIEELLALENRYNLCVNKQKSEILGKQGEGLNEIHEIQEKFKFLGMTNHSNEKETHLRAVAISRDDLGRLPQQADPATLREGNVPEARRGSRSATPTRV